MARKQTIIIFPHLNDGGGDLNKAWYVEWKYRVPGDPRQRKERIYKGLNKGTAKERRALAEKIIAEKRKWLENGGHLHGEKQVIYEDELLYRQEAKLYGTKKASVITIRKHLSDFISYKKASVNKKTLEDIRSKLRAFNAWIIREYKEELAISNINRKMIIEFGTYLATNEKLARKTISKYIQNINDFFKWALLNNLIEDNPVKEIPKFGKIVDCSATPFAYDERKRLKDAIEKRDPQLWLACEMQYYCAIRPGTELRLIKIGWIDFDKKIIRIPAMYAKSDRTDIVKIPDILFDEINKYRDYDNTLYLFGKYRMPNTEPVGKNTLRNRFNQYRDELGISKDRKFYSWKHTGAIQYIDNGMTPYQLKEHLRHTSFATTEVYLKKKGSKVINEINDFCDEI